jgi:hypothetical protein
MLNTYGQRKIVSCVDGAGSITYEKRMEGVKAFLPFEPWSQIR